MPFPPPRWPGDAARAAAQRHSSDDVVDAKPSASALPGSAKPRPRPGAAVRRVALVERGAIEAAGNDGHGGSGRPGVPDAAAAPHQIFRRNFPTNVAGANFSIPLGNRQAQGDFGIDQLQFRQSQLRGQKDANQIAVDIANQVNALRQARARYAAARNTRVLQQELLDADQKRASGLTTFNTLTNDRRGLIAAEISETNALAAYSRAQVSLDQALGATLERYDISLEEGLRGRVNLESKLPDVTDEPDK